MYELIMSGVKNPIPEPSKKTERTELKWACSLQNLPLPWIKVSAEDLTNQGFEIRGGLAHSRTCHAWLLATVSALCSSRRADKILWRYATLW